MPSKKRKRVAAPSVPESPKPLTKLFKLTSKTTSEVRHVTPHCWRPDCHEEAEKQSGRYYTTTYYNNGKSVTLDKPQSYIALGASPTPKRGPLVAAGTKIYIDEKNFVEMLKRIDSLETRVKELEGKM